MFSTQITNTVNGTYLHNQSAVAGATGLSQTAGQTSVQGGTGTNSLLRNVIGTPSMSSSTSSGYGSQAVSLGNLTNDDTLSLRSMSVDETPDMDRSSSASPPVKSTIRAGPEQNTATTPYTPSGTQKRFNPFMKDSSNVMESSASSTSTLVKTPMTPTKRHPLQNSDEEAEEAQIAEKTPAEELVEHNEAFVEQQPAAVTIEDQVSRNHEEAIAQHELVESEEGENNNSVEVVNKNEVIPLPEWVVVGESVLIRPYNTSGVISFIGPTHFQVRRRRLLGDVEEFYKN